MIMNGEIMNTNKKGRYLGQFEQRICLKSAKKSICILFLKTESDQNHSVSLLAKASPLCVHLTCVCGIKWSQTPGESHFSCYRTKESWCLRHPQLTLKFSLWYLSSSWPHISRSPWTFGSLTPSHVSTKGLLLPSLWP